MTHILFYEKPGCGGNAKQKALLQRSGHTLTVRDLLTEAWTEPTLMTYLAPLPVAEWFNRAAPKVRDGLIDPASLDATTALAMLLKEPLLIRRPLMSFSGAQGEEYFVGFDAEKLAEKLYLEGVTPSIKKTENLEACPRQATQT